MNGIWRCSQCVWSAKLRNSWAEAIKDVNARFFFLQSIHISLLPHNFHLLTLICLLEQFNFLVQLAQSFRVLLLEEFEILFQCCHPQVWIHLLLFVHMAGLLRGLCFICLCLHSRSQRDGVNIPLGEGARVPGSVKISDTRPLGQVSQGGQAGARHVSSRKCFH